MGLVLLQPTLSDAVMKAPTLWHEASSHTLTTSCHVLNLRVLQKYSPLPRPLPHIVFKAVRYILESCFTMDDEITVESFRKLLKRTRNAENRVLGWSPCRMKQHGWRGVAEWEFLENVEWESLVLWIDSTFQKFLGLYAFYSCRILF